MSGSGRAGAGTFVRVIVAWTSLAVSVICLTILFLGMRAVMGVGGTCAAGGPYLIETSCPRGIGWMIPASILVGFVAVAAYAVAVHSLPGPDWTVLAWPALFLSLGWNFWEFGLAPPAGHGVDVGWIVCGVVFVLMGALPLVWILRRADGRRALVWGDASDGGISSLHALTSTVASSYRPPATASTTAAGGDGDVTDRLERLSALRRRGDLTDDEFARAKEQLLRGEGSR